MTRIRVGLSLVACALLVGGCGTVPVASGTPRASATSAASEPGVASPGGTASPSPSAAAELPTWTWTAATVDADDPGPIVGIWPLASGFSAVATRSWDDDERDRATFLVSTDGIAWRSTPFPRTRFAYELGVVHDGALTVFGSTGPAASPTREIWRTTDGIAWDRLEGVRGLDYGPSVMETATASDTGWLACRHRDHRRRDPSLAPASPRPTCDAGASSRGRRASRTRTSARTGRAWGMLGTTFSPDLAGPFPLEVFRSTDGETWTSSLVATLPKYDSAGAIVATHETWAIGGQRFDPADESSNPIAWWSPDGVAWQEAEIVRADGLAGQANIRNMARYTEGLLATGHGDEEQVGLWLSDDGRRWTQVTPVPEGLTQLEAAARTGRDVIVSGWGGDEVGLQLWRGTPDG